MPADLTLPVQTLASQLLACESVTPAEGGCMPIVSERLQGMGFDCRYINRNGVSNLWARRGHTSPLFVFAGHVDVVPPGPLEQWVSPPFSPQVRDGYLYGRGAADMKSSIAAFICGLEVFLAEQPNYDGSMALLITSDEEADAVDGTAAVIEVLKTEGVRFDYCLIGEPTAVDVLGDNIKNGRRGSLSGTLHVKGIQGHIAYPHLARNPVLEASPALVELANTKWDEGNESFPPTSWQVSNINAGTGATNVIPGEMKVMFNFRFSTSSTVQGLQERTTAILQKHKLNYEITWSDGGQPFLSPRGELVDAACGAIKQELALDSDVTTSGGTSDGRFICQICDQLVEIGPVNATSHKINECVRVDDLQLLQKVYLNLMRRLLTSPSV